MDAFISLSLVTAFVAGVVALFAPCCITFLLPTYFANVFREKRRVLLMTFVYSMGIFTVMLPVVLGARILTDFFYSAHDQLYIVGGIMLVAVGLGSLLGFKLPMPKINFTPKLDDPISTYTLGLVSGVTSACCAPVLLGVLALSAMTPNILSSALVGLMYVSGMVAPLYLASLFIERKNILQAGFLRRPLYEGSLGNRTLVITTASLVAFIAFTGVGLAAIFLSLAGKLSMKAGEDQFAETIKWVADSFSQWISVIPGLDWVLLLLFGYAVYRLLKNIRS